MHVVRLESVTRGNWHVAHSSPVPKFENFSCSHGWQTEWSADGAEPGRHCSQPVWFAFDTNPIPLTLHGMHWLPAVLYEPGRHAMQSLGRLHKTPSGQNDPAEQRNVCVGAEHVV